MTLVLPLSAVLLGFSAGRSPAAEIADLPSANGGTQHIWYAAPADPWAVAIMFIGGDGVIPWEADGSLKGGRSTRQLWLDQGIAVLIAGKPTWLTVAYSYRLTDAYARDIRSLVDFARARAPVPVWLLGHSLGNNAVASGASRLTQGEIAGVVFVSPTTHHGPQDALTEAVFDMHRHDRCSGACRHARTRCVPHHLP
jgi:pimeloyl-ACP methyl ester carboxylesterase